VQIKKFGYSETEISDIAVDTNNSEYLWVAFKQDTSGNCKLKKVSAHNPLQTYYDIDITTTEISKMIIYSTDIYVALNDTTYIASIYSITNPIGDVTNVDIPSGITQKPIDIVVGNYLYILLPGSTSGTNAKICVFTTAGVFSETIDLSTVTNAESFTIDSNNNLWVVTNELAAKLIRVYDDGGWTIQSTTL